MASEHFDVVIVGAGLSGIGAGYHLQTLSPDRSFTILEARDAIGGTWDLFRYPGIRSDSDMYTLGYGFRPWKEAKAIADGPSILRYVRETARDYGIDRHIRFNHKVTRADWSTAEAAWTVDSGRPISSSSTQFLNSRRNSIMFSFVSIRVHSWFNSMGPAQRLPCALCGSQSASPRAHTLLQWREPPRAVRQGF